MCMALLCTLTCITRECKKREKERGDRLLDFKYGSEVWEGNKRQAAALESVLLGGCISC